MLTPLVPSPKRSHCDEPSRGLSEEERLEEERPPKRPRAVPVWALEPAAGRPIDIPGEPPKAPAARQAGPAGAQGRDAPRTPSGEGTSSGAHVQERVVDTHVRTSAGQSVVLIDDDSPAASVMHSYESGQRSRDTAGTSGAGVLIDNGGARWDTRDKGKAPADERPAVAPAMVVRGDKLQITSTVSRTFTCPICFEHVEKGG